MWWSPPPPVICVSVSGRGMLAVGQLIRVASALTHDPEAQLTTAAALGLVDVAAALSGKLSFLMTQGAR